MEDTKKLEERLERVREDIVELLWEKRNNPKWLVVSERMLSDLMTEESDLMVRLIKSR